MGLGKTLRQTSQNGPNLDGNLRLMDEFGANGIVWGATPGCPAKAIPRQSPRRRMRPPSTGSLPMRCRACRHQLNKWSPGDLYQSTHTDDRGRPLIRTDEFVGERSPDAK
jgi:hypothetical protein